MVAMPNEIIRREIFKLMANLSLSGEFDVKMISNATIEQLVYSIAHYELLDEQMNLAVLCILHSLSCKDEQVRVSLLNMDLMIYLCHYIKNKNDENTFPLAVATISNLTFRSGKIQSLPTKQSIEKVLELSWKIAADTGRESPIILSCLQLFSNLISCEIENFCRSLVDEFIKLLGKRICMLPGSKLKH